MSTAKQIAANRRNAKLSSGPRTDEGKARVRQNALRHGLCSDFPRLCEEKKSEIQQFLDTLREEHQPFDATEEILVYKMAEQFWVSKRVSEFLARQMDIAFNGRVDVAEMGLMLRYQTTADRAYFKALTELRKLQKERELQEIGFDSQNLGAAPDPPRPETPDSPQPPIVETQPASMPPKTSRKPAEFVAPDVHAAPMAAPAATILAKEAA